MDMEKVIKGLECCSKTDMCCMEINCYHPAYLECPYHEIEDGCIQAITKDALELLKEQEADKNKYEYKIDHTDCLWYGSGNCPSTCSQYRDGWNDAMDYIFKNGKGYQPYRRSVNSDE